MLLTTTQQIEGHTIREYKGVVTGEHQWNGGCHLKVFADEFNDIMDV